MINTFTGKRSLKNNLQVRDKLTEIFQEAGISISKGKVKYAIDFTKERNVDISFMAYRDLK